MPKHAIIVSTTANLSIHTAIFSIKHFELAIIDEASQILEPNIVGLLAAHNGEKQVIDKFILIGDYKQLPAVVQQDSEESATNSHLLENIHLPNCANSLFERLILTEQAAHRTNFCWNTTQTRTYAPRNCRFSKYLFLCTRTIRMCTAITPKRRSFVL